jgi:microcin C transport system substrate-binding protein
VTTRRAGTGGPGRLTRRQTLAAGAAALTAALPGFAVAAPEAGEVESHGISAFGDLKYPAGFRNFDYIDPQARTGSTFSQTGSVRYYNQNFLTFDSLNGFILRGDAALGIERTFATLMKRAWDEPDALYGLAARAVRVSADGRVYCFVLRPQARFHDGSPLTAHDVAFSLNLLKDKGHQLIRQQLREFEGAEAADDGTLVARFIENRARDVPLYLSELPIFSRAYYSARSFEESTLEVPLGSGAYKVGRFEPGRYIEYERVKDWWGADLPVSRGQNNFDVLRYEYYREREAGFQAFTARSYLFRENSRRACGRRATTFQRSATGGSNARNIPTSGRRARKGGSSTRGGTSSRTGGCARPSTTPSTSSGPTRTSCTARISAPVRYSKIPT